MPTALEPQLFDRVEEGLKDVIDPELGVNIVDLGTAVMLGLVPFLIGDALKALLAAGLLPATWKLISRAESKPTD